MKWHKIEYGEEDDIGYKIPKNPPPSDVDVLFYLERKIYAGTYTYIEKGMWVEEDEIFVCLSGPEFEWDCFFPDYWTEYSEDGIE